MANYRLLPFVLLLIAIGIMPTWGQETVDVTAIKRLPLAGPIPPILATKLQAGIWQTIPRATFEARIEQLQEAKDPKRKPKLIQAQYELLFRPDSADLATILGTGQFRILHPGQQPASLPLEPFNAALQSATWSQDNSPAIVAVAANNPISTLMLQIPREGEQKLQTQFSLRPWFEQGRWRFDWSMPIAPLAAMQLDLPEDFIPETDQEDAYVTGPYSSPIAGNMKRWQIQIGGISNIKIALRSRENERKEAPLFRVKQLSRYEMEPEVMRARFNLEIEPIRGSSRELVLDQDATLTVTDVQLNGLESWMEKILPNGQKQLLLKVRESFRSSRLEIQAIAEPPLSTSNALSLPKLQLQYTLPYPERIDLSLDPEVSLSQFQLGSFELQNALRDAQDHYVLQCISNGNPGAKADRPKVALRLVRAHSFSVRQRLDWYVEPNLQRLQTRIEIELESGSLRRIPLRIPPGWEIQRIEGTPAEIAPTIVSATNPVEIEFVKEVLGPRTFQLDLTLEQRRQMPGQTVFRLPYPDVVPLGAQKRDGTLNWYLSPRLELYPQEETTKSATGLEGIAFQGILTPGVLQLQLRPERWRAASRLKIEPAPNHYAFEATFPIEPEAGELNSILLAWPCKQIPGVQDYRIAQGDASIQSIEVDHSIAISTIASIYCSQELFPITTFLAVCHNINPVWQRIRFRQPITKKTTVSANWIVEKTPTTQYLPLLLDPKGIGLLLYLQTFDRAKKSSFVLPTPQLLGVNESPKEISWEKPHQLSSLQQMVLADAHLHATILSDRLQYQLSCQLLLSQGFFEFALPEGCKLTEIRLGEQLLEPEQIDRAGKGYFRVYMPVQEQSQLTIRYYQQFVTKSWYVPIDFTWPELPQVPRQKRRTLQTNTNWQLLDRNYRWQQPRPRTEWLTKWANIWNSSQVVETNTLAKLRDIPKPNGPFLYDWLQVQAKVGLPLLLHSSIQPLLQQPFDSAQFARLGMADRLCLVESEVGGVLVSQEQFGLWQMNQWLQGNRLQHQPILYALQQARRFGQDRLGEFSTIAWLNLQSNQLANTGFTSHLWLDQQPESTAPILILHPDAWLLLVIGFSVFWYLFLGLLLQRHRFALISGLLLFSLCTWLLPECLSSSFDWLVYLYLAAYGVLIVHAACLRRHLPFSPSLFAITLFIAYRCLSVQAAAVPEAVIVYEYGNVMLVPSPLWEQLSASTSPLQEYCFTRAKYTGGERDGTAEITAEYDLTTWKRQTVLTLPFSGARLREVTLNRMKLFPSAEGNDRYSIDIPEAGNYKLIVRLSIPIQLVADEQEIKFGIPECACTSFEFRPNQADIRHTPNLLPWRGEVTWKDGVLHAELGRAKQIVFRWGTTQSKVLPDNRVTEANLWDLSPGNATLQTSAEFRLNSPADRFEWSVPVELDVAKIEARIDGAAPIPHGWIREWRMENESGDSRRLVVELQHAVSGKIRFLLDFYPKSALGLKPTLRIPKARNIVESESYIAYRLTGLEVLGDVERAGLVEYSALLFGQDIWRSPIIGPVVVPSRAFRKQGTGSVYLRPNLSLPTINTKGDSECQITLDAATSIAQIRYRFEAITERISILEWPVPASWQIEEVRCAGMRMWLHHGGRLQIWFDQPVQAGLVTWFASFKAGNRQIDKQATLDVPAMVPIRAEVTGTDWSIRLPLGFSADVEAKKGLVVKLAPANQLALQTSEAVKSIRLQLVPKGEPEPRNRPAELTGNRLVEPIQTVPMQPSIDTHLPERGPQFLPTERWLQQLDVGVRLSILFCLSLFALLLDRGRRRTVEQLAVWCLMIATLLQPEQGIWALIGFMALFCLRLIMLIRPMAEE